MNDNRRKKLETVSSKLDELKMSLQDVVNDEQYSFDNLPEQFQEGERGEKMEEAISNLEDAIDYIDSAMESISEATA